MKALTLVSVAVLAACALSQGPGGQRGQGGPGGPRMGGMRPTAFFAFMPDVQKELGLTAAQKDKLGKIMQDQMNSMRPPKGDQGGKPPERPNPGDFAKRMQETQNKVNAVLTAAQRARLDQIGLQVQGPAAMTNPDVAKKVGLTAKQQASIKAIVEKSRPEFGRPQQGQQTSPQDFEKRMKEMQAKREAANKAILAALTPAQKATWTKMLGKPFNLQMRRGGEPGRTRTID